MKSYNLEELKNLSLDDFEEKVAKPIGRRIQFVRKGTPYANSVQTLAEQPELKVLMKKYFGKTYGKDKINYIENGRYGKKNPCAEFLKAVDLFCEFYNVSKDDLYDDMKQEKELGEIGKIGFYEKTNWTKTAKQLIQTQTQGLSSELNQPIIHQKSEIKPVIYTFFDPTQESKIDTFLVENIYMERKEVLAQIEQHLSKGEKCIYVCGEPGIGKSALSAYLIRKIQKEENAAVIYHLIGFSRKNWKDIVFSLLEQMQMKYGSKLEHPIIPDNTSDLKDDGVIQLYRQGLFSVSKILENEKNKQKKLVIVIDALDELELQGENPGKNTCFQIVPCESLWENISFFVTSRSGDTLSNFLNYMSCRLPAVIELKRMDKAELEALAKLYKVSLNEQQISRLLNISGKAAFKLTDQAFPELMRNRVSKEIVNLLHSLKNKEYKTEPDFLTALQEKLGEKAAVSHKSLFLKLAKQSEGNFLYVTELLKRLQENKDYDLSELPSTVIGFFRKELTEKFRIKDNDLLRQILALIKVFKIHPSDQHFIQLIGREKEKEIKTLLEQISCYLNVFPFAENREQKQYPKLSHKIYSFFHFQFEESLTHFGYNEKGFYEYELISKEDIQNAHQLIIEWCDGEKCRFETLDENDPRFQYGFDYLPYHYWEKGEYDNFEGFLEFLGRGKVKCEIACRKYLREKYLFHYGKDPMQEDIIKSKFKMMFKNGNDAAKHALIRFDGDITGVVHDGIQKDIWSDIINELPPDSYWYDEIIRNKTVEFSSGTTFLDVLKQRVQQPENFSCINHLRGFYFRLGIRLCTPAYSNKFFNPVEGFEYLDKAKNILESMTAQDLLESSCKDIKFAEYQLNRLKGFFFNDYGISLRRIGKIDDAINYYNKALDFYDSIVSQEKESYLRNKISGSISTTSHNLAHLMTLRGNNSEALHLYDRSLLIRVENGRNISINNTLLQLNYIFHDLLLKDLYTFIQYFIHFNDNPQILSDRITNLERYRDYLFTVQDYSQAETAIDELISLRLSKKNKSYVTDFENFQDKLSLLVLQKKKTEALTILKNILSIIEQNKDDKTIVIASRDYYDFWEDAAQTYLLNDQIDNSDKIIQKLSSWFENYRFSGLMPRYCELKAKYCDQIGQTGEAKRFRSEANRLINEGCKAIADKHFPPEVMQYLDYLVESSDDSKLKEMYDSVKDDLAHGFCPK